MSLSSSSINCHVPKISYNAGFEKRLVFSHPLLKHFLQGVRCQHPVISGVAGGSWHPFKRTVQAVGQCLFLLAFINYFKSACSHSQIPLSHGNFTACCLSHVTTSRQFVFESALASAVLVFLYINWYYSLTFHELTSCLRDRGLGERMKKRLLWTHYLAIESNFLFV